MSKNKSKKTKQAKKAIAIAYYKKNPVIFFERELGVELYAWQKMWLNLMFKWGYKNGNK